MCMPRLALRTNVLTTYVWVTYITALLLLSTAVMAHRAQHVTGRMMGSGPGSGADLILSRHQNPLFVSAMKTAVLPGSTWFVDFHVMIIGRPQGMDKVE